MGKTATATQRARTVISLDNPPQLELLRADLDRVAREEAPVFIDEWQLLPPAWDRVRRLVDSNHDHAGVLLAGSAGIASGVRIHSGAGRIVKMTMRPLSFAERGLAVPTVSLASLLADEPAPIEGASPLGLTDYVEEILSSGFPGIRGLPASLRSHQLDSYVERIVMRELPEQGIAVRRRAALRSWLAAYGAASSTTAAYSTILDAATPGESDKPARQTAAIYREHLQRLFVLDPLEAWTPAFAPLKRLATAPKHHLVDPALAARLLQVDAEDLMRGHGARVGASTGTWLGALFESLVAQAVRVYAGVNRARTGHMRLRDSKREIDLIVEGRGMRVVAIEVKLAATIDNNDVRHLNWLKDALGDRVADRVVVTTGPHAYRRADGVAVVPLALLGP